MTQETQKKEAWTPEKFAEEYQKLVEKSGFAIAPIWVATNHGSFELSLSVTKR